MWADSKQIFVAIGKHFFFFVYIEYSHGEILYKCSYYVWSYKQLQG